MLWLEFKKLLEQRIIGVFILLCVVFNLLMIINIGFDQSYLKDVTAFKHEQGQLISPTSIETAEKLPFSKNQQRLVNELSEAEDVFSHLFYQELEEQVIDHYQVTGKMSQNLGNKYQQLEPVIKKLSQEKDALDIAAAGDTMNYFTYIRNVLFRMILLEGIIFAVLIGLYSSTSEKLTKTEALVFTSKRGRKIQFSKFLSGLGLVLLFYLLTTFIVMFSFQMTESLADLWQSSVSTQFHVNIYMPDILELPFITWIPLTLWGYIMASAVLGLFIIIFIYSSQFLVGLYFNHIFKGFVFTIFLIALHKLVRLYAFRLGWWTIFTGVNFLPIAIVENQSYWFTEMGIFSIIPLQETVVVVSSCLILGLLILPVSRLYSRKEVK
ncbi:hypothetical protein [Vagococcus hydrophili]|uniref:Uncharacterized protein n=1 Tax=Vagococcus hydrophili TaxID=2714947 RepID=A0A6G8ASW2_9ENTE|nr:hypothetical protein [Vagococcus hydrophili]QIL48154.1 hypothetical protein G7082_06455 [Vagococcus hydrophili]